METEEILTAVQRAAETVAAPNWADKLSVAISLLAVFVAGFVAWKQSKIARSQNEITKKQAEISEQQNKIALFKERYLVYTELYKFFSISTQMKLDLQEGETHFKDFSEDNKKIFLRVIEAVFVINLNMGSDVEDDPSSVETLVTLLSYIQQAFYQIRRAKFLFPEIKESDIEKLLNAWTEFVTFLTTREKELNGADKRFIEICDHFMDTYLDIMEEQLDLK